MNKRLHVTVITLVLLLFGPFAFAHTAPIPTRHAPVVFSVADSVGRDSFAAKQNVDTLYSNEEFKKEKLIAAILAFPVPFGFTGLHRIYLGSDPWIPVVYLITGGGGFGLIPLIDFIFIVTADEEQFRKYESNPKFFMWVE